MAPDYIELPAVDVEATKRFYTEAFGWQWTDYGPGYACCETGTPQVALSGSASVGSAHPAGAQDAIGPFVLLSTDDLADAQSRVLAAGGTIVSDPYDYPGGRRLHFADPSGNVLGVYQSGGEAPAE